MEISVWRSRVIVVDEDEGFEGTGLEGTTCTVVKVGLTVRVRDQSNSNQISSHGCGETSVCLSPCRVLVERGRCP